MSLIYSAYRKLVNSITEQETHHILSELLQLREDISSTDYEIDEIAEICAYWTEEASQKDFKSLLDNEKIKNVCFLEFRSKIIDVYLQYYKKINQLSHDFTDIDKEAKHYANWIAACKTIRSPQVIQEADLYIDKTRELIKEEKVCLNSYKNKMFSSIDSIIEDYNRHNPDN